MHYYIPFNAVCYEGIINNSTCNYTIGTRKLTASERQQGTNVTIPLTFWSTDPKYIGSLPFSNLCLWSITSLEQCIEVDLEPRDPQSMLEGFISFLSPRNRVGGDIVTAVREWVGEWVGLWVGAWVRHALPCGHDSDYSFGPINFKLHIHIRHDERRNPIDIGSRGQRSRSTLALYV